MQNFNFKSPVLTSLVLRWSFVKNIYSKSSDINECFILIFTCATSRFTYLELSPDMTSVPFINCFQRFISRCGTPTKIVSDNFKSFKSNETEAYFKEINVIWKPILEKSPWGKGWFLRKAYSNIKISFTKNCRIS